MGRIKGRRKWREKRNRWVRKLCRVLKFARIAKIGRTGRNRLRKSRQAVIRSLNSWKRRTNPCPTLLIYSIFIFQFMGVVMIKSINYRKKLMANSTFKQISPSPDIMWRSFIGWRRN